MRFFYFVLLLAQLSGCANPFCSPGAEEPYRAREVAMGIRDVEDVVTLPSRDVIVVSRRFPMGTVVTRIGGLSEEQPVALLPPMAPTDVAPSLMLVDGDWWFSRMGFQNEQAIVFFVSGGETGRENQPPIVGYGAAIAWLPVRGVEPHGLLISAASEQPALRVTEVSPSEIKPLAAFPWWQTSASMRVRHDSRWSAASLGGGRYIVAAIDGPPGQTALQVRTVGGAGANEAVAPCRFADQPIDTAVDPTGRLAVVGLSEKREVVAALVDVDHVESAQCRTVSPAGEVAATPGYATPTVVWAGDRFIAAWLRDDGAVRACEVSELQKPPLVVDVGADADVRRPLRQLLQSGTGTVMFTWRDRSGDVVTREMPNELTGYTLGTELRRAVCSALATAAQKAAHVRALVRLQLHRP